MHDVIHILGRGKAGRSLAQALWKSSADVKVQLHPSSARPEGWVLLAVPDSAIAGLAKAFPGRCAHLSGSLHVDGVPCLHPLTSFDGEAGDYEGVPLAITGEVHALFLKAFQGLGFVPFELLPEDKALYHACAVMASGHAATLWLGAEQLLADKGIVLPGQGLRSLAQATLHNVFTKGKAGRTGPFVRGDEATILRDQKALPAPWQDLFVQLGKVLP